METRAMHVVTGHFARDGWMVTDVPAAESFDLLLTSVRPATACRGEGNHLARYCLILTHEVVAVRRDPEATVLAIVHSITLNSRRTTATGGLLKIIHPWRPADEALSPIAYRYQVSQQTPLPDPIRAGRHCPA